MSVLPGLRFCVKFCSALIADSNEDLEWEATMQRSREMKDAKKRDNERREAERQAAKAIEREKRKRKVRTAVTLGSPPPDLVYRSASGRSVRELVRVADGDRAEEARPGSPEIS